MRYWARMTDRIQAARAYIQAETAQLAAFDRALADAEKLLTTIEQRREATFAEVDSIVLGDAGRRRLRALLRHNPDARALMKAEGAAALNAMKVDQMKRYASQVGIDVQAIADGAIPLTARRSGLTTRPVRNHLP
jgi:hypothetical protein